MKTIFAILTILTLISTASYAQFDPQQNEIARTVTQLTSVDAVIKTIKLNESGVLTVIKQDGSFKTLKLTQANHEALLNTARSLAEVEVTVDHRAAVCEIMIVPYSVQNLSIIDLENNKLKLLLSPSSCAFATYTHPTDASSLDMANSFKAELIALARQTLAAQEYVAPF